MEQRLVTYALPFHEVNIHMVMRMKIFTTLFMMNDDVDHINHDVDYVDDNNDTNHDDDHDEEHDNNGNDDDNHDNHDVDADDSGAVSWRIRVVALTHLPPYR